MILVYLTTNRFKDEPQYFNAIQVNLPSTTSDTLVLARFAFLALKKIFRPGFNYKKIGVILAGLAPDNQTQTDLFWQAQDEKSRLLMECLDQLNSRYGSGTIQLGSSGIRKSWQMRREKKSPNYTTRWDELPVVRAM